jgi:hypothetical protein
MLLTCPKCNVKISAFKISSLFRCSSCSAKLTGKTVGPAIWAALLASLFELITYPLVYSSFGSAWLGTSLRFIIIGCVFVTFYGLFINSFCEIKIRND